MTLLLCCIALLVGGALGAAWRRAETRAWRENAKMLSRQYWGTARECWEAPLHTLPMSCSLGSRPSESVRREGPTVARTLDQLMEER